MSLYRYQFCDLRTDAHIVDLPLTGVRFDRRICQPGTFSGTIPITNAKLADRAALVVPRSADDISRGPGRTVVHVWRGDRIWGSYIIWSARVTADDRGRVSIALSGAGLESWLHRRRQTSQVYSQVDQLDIARDMVERAQSTGGPADIGVITGGQASSGILRDRTYDSFDWETIGRRLEQLSEVINGPEWAIFTYPDASGNRIREFRVSQVLGTGTVHRISQPGTLVDWRYTIDGTDATTYHYVRGGSNDGSGGRVYTASGPAGFTGWPTLMAIHDYPNVTSGLGEYRDWWVTHRSAPRRIMEATVRVPREPTLTPDHLGDPARLVVVNPWWPLDPSGAPTFDEARRIVGMDVRPPDRGSPETMRLAFEEPREDGAAADGYGRPQYTPEITDMLASLPAALRAMLTGSVPPT